MKTYQELYFTGTHENLELFIKDIKNLPKTTGTMLLEIT